MWFGWERCALTFLHQCKSLNMFLGWKKNPFFILWERPWQGHMPWFKDPQVSHTSNQIYSSNSKTYPWGCRSTILKCRVPSTHCYTSNGFHGKADCWRHWISSKNLLLIFVCVWEKLEWGVTWPRAWRHWKRLQIFAQYNVIMQNFTYKNT